jgi:hypothetical protein
MTNKSIAKYFKTKITGNRCGYWNFVVGIYLVLVFLNIGM